MTPSPSGEPTDSTFYYVPGDSKRHHLPPGAHNRADTQIYSDGRYSMRYADDMDAGFERGGYMRDSLLVYDEGHKTGKFAQIDEEDFRNDIRYETDLYASRNRSRYAEDDIYGIGEPIYYAKSRKEVLENIYGGKTEERRVDKQFVQREDYMPYSDIETSSEYDPDSPTDMDGSLLYMYETTQRRRSMAVPATQSGLKRRYSTAGMPHNQEYDRYGTKVINSDYYSTRPSTYGKIERSQSLYDRMENEQSIYGRINSHKIYGRTDNNQIYGRIGDIATHPRVAPVPIYDDTYVKRGMQPKPGNFGLSNYGHLKIDYSCSWNSLDRFIGK